jgi:hypothetical protein
VVLDKYLSNGLERKRISFSFLSLSKDKTQIKIFLFKINDQRLSKANNSFRFLWKRFFRRKFDSLLCSQISRHMDFYFISRYRKIQTSSDPNNHK